jgi:D-alanyl-D-alanine carboxypeptidase (penicillin-binding protein 5/6)
MTALTAIERLPPNAMIAVNALTASQPASKIGMLAGQRWTLNDTLASLMVVSANDAAYALAQAVAPTIPGFVQAETVTAHQLGLRDSTFADPAGLDDGNAYNGGPMMSAYDIAISARNALAVPAIANYAASPVVTFVGPGGVHHTLTNHNKLVSEHLYAGATGFKTGFTNKAGHTLIATATRNGRTLIAVILGTDDAYGWAGRFLDAGFGDSATPGANGSLPPVRVTTYSQRAAQFAAFHTLAAGSQSSSQSSSNQSSQSTVASPSSTARAGSTGTAAASQLGGTLAASHVAKKAGHGHSTTTIVIAVLLVLLAILYVLRVRAVRRARARRLARRREAHNMMRRGSLPIVDGRYRTGTRVGKPVESHVQIRREREREERRRQA